LKQRLLSILARVFLVPVYRLWCATLRFELYGSLPDSGTGALLAFWHCDIFSAVAFLTQRRSRSGSALGALVSPSADGLILARLLQRFDVVTFLGSSDREGFSAFMQSAAYLKSGGHLMITPDGPKGPARQMQPGLSRLARHCEVPIAFVRIGYAGCVRLKSWDSFVLPLPFTKCSVEVSTIAVTTRELNQPGDLQCA